MRILHIISDIYEGGVATIAYELVRYQVLHNNEVTLLCTINTQKQISRAQYFIDAGVNVVFAPFENSYNPRIIFFLRKEFIKYDIVHVHHFPNQLFARIAALTIPKGKRPILITTEHSTYNNRRKYEIFRILDRWMYRGYNKIICISKQTETNIKSWLHPFKNIENSIITIQNGIDLQKYALLTQYLNDKINRNIIMVSRLEPPKDPFTVVRAISKCEKDVHVYFIGSGSLSDQVRDLAKELSVEDRVHLLGNRNDVPNILHNFSIGVLSTIWEGFGLVLVEYMAAGLPVLVSDAEGMIDIVKDEYSIFPIGNDEILSKKIMKILNDRVIYNKMSKNSILQSKEFSVEKMNKLYLDTYKGLLTKKYGLNFSNVSFQSYKLK